MEIRLLDILDIFLVALLIYQLYRLLKGSLAFYIFLGLVSIYMIYFGVRALNMNLLSGILGQFIDVGVILLLIIFQPEVRRFLLIIGRGSHFKRNRWLKKWFPNKIQTEEELESYIEETLSAIAIFQKAKTGSLIVFANTSKLQFFANSGVKIDAVISSKLLESIFEKNSPLHDGAVIISENKIMAAGCTLPVSENEDLPDRVGVRHKAAVGITEQSDALAIIVSEEKGTISYARGGNLIFDIKISDLRTLLRKIMVEDSF
ncbi:MAG: TIGR00159 family protein [Chitinophagaceae bacterium]|nr:MAG: TIGR00159 family protein [Chitinophagaceae bacterium]